MALRVDERADDFAVVDQFENGVTWIAHPDEAMQRASHALEIDGKVWVIDPVDADGLDELLADYGDVTGVVVLLDRHTRDAAAIANRHEVPVFLPESFDDITGEDLEAPVARFRDKLSTTGLEAHTVVNNRFWKEVALYNPDDGTLVVPESVGTVEYFCAGAEPLGVHPMQRLVPPRETLGGFAPDRILVGHGPGVHSKATGSLEDALATARRRTPRVYAGALWRALPF
ncbi:hypothetical protein [Natronolimnobius baerhuensis]|uniref:MBL fold metallo-hydrolase n=1 Tax=Natronolimnobius baerhuensis TaxID=253108 RepID=A0A202ECC2_9EURY|nr:hypothetical protein [Natronolimnobius baerhuensis]OVE85867.1 hypothetical protein B2G88_03385 [Natronolimnobius baerhuensis]